MFIENVYVDRGLYISMSLTILVRTVFCLAESSKNELLGHGKPRYEAVLDAFVDLLKIYDR